MAAFLSGEMKDTVEINPMASYLLEKMFSRKERADLFRGWAGSASMWLKVRPYYLDPARCVTADPQCFPKGGDAIWGDQDSAPDDPENATDTHGRFLSFREEDQSSSEHDLTSETIWPNLTQSDSNVFILKNTPLTFQVLYQSKDFIAALYNPLTVHLPITEDGRHQLLKRLRGRSGHAQEEQSGAAS